MSADPVLDRAAPRRALLAGAALLLAASSLGCAKMGYGPRTLADETVLRTRHQLLDSSDPQTTLKQSGTEIRVTAMQLCDLVEQKEIRRTYAQEKENKALVPELVLLSLGAVPAGLGVAFLVDSKNVYENDRHARLYNPSGKSGAVAAGFVLLAWGAAFMAVPLVDFARTGGSKEDKETVTEEGERIRRGVPCPSARPAEFRVISGRVPGDTFALGRTDDAGVFAADLVQVVPSRIFESSRPPASMEVLIGSAVVGTASLARVAEIQVRDRHLLDAAAWSEVDVIACRSASPDRPACDAVRAYMQRFPNGERRDEARQLLDPSTRSGSIQVAASPEDLAKAEAAKKAAADATDAAKKAAADACRKKCEASCKKEGACTTICVAEACR